MYIGQEKAKKFEFLEPSDATAATDDTPESQFTERLGRRHSGRHDSHDPHVGVRAAPAEELQGRHCTGKYRAEKKSLQILLSRTQAGPGRKVKQEQEEISRNHVPRLFLGSVFTIGVRSMSLSLDFSPWDF